jgi:hypothetical protein
MARGWKFWRKVFTAACYSSIMSIQITSSIVAPIFAIAGPGFGLTTSEVAQVFSVYYLPNVGSSLAALCSRRSSAAGACCSSAAPCYQPAASHSGWCPSSARALWMTAAERRYRLV